MARLAASWVPALSFALSVTSLAPAQPEPEASDDEARAKQLFEEGREEIHRGALESGCGKMSESHRLAPAAVGPLLNLADCDERGGKLASAWRRFLAAAELPEASAERRDYALRRAESLHPRVPRVVLTVPDSPSGLRISLDGEALEPSTLGEPLLLDPGPHRFVVEALDRQHRTFEIVLVPEQSYPIALEPGPPVEAVTAPIPPPPEPRESSLPSRAPADEPSLDEGMEGQAIAGWVVGGVGLAALVVGTITGVLVGVHAKTYDDHCRGGRCDPEGLEAARAGRPLAIASPVSFAVGGVALGISIPLLLTASSPPAGSAWMPPTGMALRLGGSF
ncbi:MAG: hypothetical protein R3B72_35670 [Polyangiaceae bacterium]